MFINADDLIPKLLIYRIRMSDMFNWTVRASASSSTPGYDLTSTYMHSGSIVGTESIFLYHFSNGFYSAKQLILNHGNKMDFFLKVNETFGMVLKNIDIEYMD